MQQLAGIKLFLFVLDLELFPHPQIAQVASSGFFKSTLSSSEAVQQQQYFPLLPQVFIFLYFILYIIYHILYFEMINCYNSSADHLATHRPTGSWWRSQPRFVELSHDLSVVSGLWYSQLIFVTTATTSGGVLYSNWCPF